jgi:hypothetical protein
LTTATSAGAPTTRTKASAWVEVVPAAQLAGAVEALREIATRRPVVERNPDGDDQAAHAMQMVARAALAALPND